MNAMSMSMLWLRAFLLTVVIEELIAVPLLAPVERAWGRRILAVLLANLATHPLVWFFFTRLGWSWTMVSWVAEAWAFGFEIVAYHVIFHHASWKRCAFVSVAANMGSYLLGLVVTKWGLLH